MKLTQKKIDALNVLVWVVLCIASLVAMMITEKNTYGFCSIFCLIWFLNEDREYKTKYPKKEDKE
ncbi:MAG: hypothetical protein IJY59_01885 [Bacteroidaceae bacterium]|nr:hypothetical protein [Bacteroidaceae bacterium]